MDVYYDRDLDKANYIPLITFNLNLFGFDGHQIPSGGEIIIENNNTLLFKSMGKLYPINCLSHVAIIGLYSILRGDNQYKLSFRVVQTVLGGKALYAKIYVNTEYINKLCDTFSVTPPFIENIIRDKHEKPDDVFDYNIDVCKNVIIYDHDWSYINDLNLKPFEYQKNNVSWMYNVERNISMGYHNFPYVVVNDLLRLESNRIMLYMDAGSNIIHSDNSIWRCEHRAKTFKPLGGVICDDMGLGKTFSVTSLVLANPVKNMLPRIVIAHKDKVHTKPIYQSRATLVLCPRRLVAQWISEIDKYISNKRKYNIVEMSTMAHVKKYKYQDICDMDIVVVSFSLLQNKSYEDQAILDLTNIMWHRIIVDEGHEILLHNIKKMIDVRIAQIVFNMKATYKWVCTGTPLPKLTDSMDGILSFLTDLPVYKKSDILDNINNKDLNRLKTLIFHRNTKESTNKEVYIPPPIESTDFLDFSPVEKTLYEAATGDTLRQIQLCTNILVSDTDTNIIGGKALSLDQVNKTMITYYRTEIDKYDKLILQTTDEHEQLLEDEEVAIAEFNLLIDDAVINNDITREKDLKIERNNAKQKFNNKKRSAKDRTVAYNVELAHNKTKLKQFLSLDTETMQNSNCPVLDIPLRGKTIAITPHGHFYSQDAINMLFSNRKTINCPYTREPLTYADLLMINTQSTDSSDTISLNVNKWGTKMAHLIETIHTIIIDSECNRIILFSQWKKMLDLVGVVLTEANIQHVFCRGNVHMMSKSIRNFKEDPKIKVILLSSENCSSGSNLTEASHIILLDTVNTNPENAKAIENQAISRSARLGQSKNIIVKRFIIRDTIEETYYKNSQGIKI